MGGVWGGGAEVLVSLGFHWIYHTAFVSGMAELPGKIHIQNWNKETDGQMTEFNNKRKAYGG